MTAPDRLDIVPDRLVDPIRRKPLRARIGTAFGDGLLSALLNGAVVGWLAAQGWPLRSVEAPPSAISVDLVDHMPGQNGGETAENGAKPDQAGPTAAKAAQVQPEAKPSAPEPAPEKRPEPPAAEADAGKQPVPATAAGKPPSGSAEEAPSQTGRDNEQQASDAKPAPSGSAAEQATPATPEHPDAKATPHLVEAPEAPHTAAPNPEPAIQPQATQAAPADEGRGADVSAPAPSILSGAGDDTVPAATPPTPATPKPPSAEEQRQAEATAKLAAMLPYGANIMGAALPSGISEGRATSDSYRGAVYGNFSKAQDVIAAARAKHLKGQAVVAFTVDDHGGLASLALAVSSGNADVDAAALELIRRSAPFPPPPPGAQRSFSPAIGLGLGD